MPERPNPGKAESQMTLASSRSGVDDRSSGWWVRRTRMERYLMLGVTTVVFVVLCLAVGMAAVVTGMKTAQETPSSLIGKPLVATYAEHPDNVCLTKGCVKAAASLIERMDDEENPCEDFYNFACGGYTKSRIIPDDKTSISQFTDISERLREKLRVLVESKIEDTDFSSTAMVKNLYKSCMNEEYVKAQGLKPLQEVLKILGGWPVVEGNAWNEDAFEWYSSMYKNRRLGYSVDYIIDFSVTTNLRNSSWRILDLDQPPLGMPSRKYLLKGFNDSDVQAYYNYQVNLATMLGANKERAKKELKDSLEFEIQLANFSLPKEERRNASKLYNKMTIDDLSELAANIPWLEYINTLLPPQIKVDRSEPIIVNVPSFVRNLSRLLDETPKRTIANYIMWRVSSSSVGYLSDDVRDLQLEYSKIITGKGKRESRWKECMSSVSGSLSHAVGSLYARTFFKEDAKSAADEMVAYIRTEFDKILHSIDWMDAKTRNKALEKSKAITPHIAYPEELLMQEKLTELYDGLGVSDGDLLSNMRNLTVFGTDYAFKRLREKVDKQDWRNHGAAAIVNAFYSPLENSIQFPAGILQGTFFEADRPKYLNFGAIGYVIGHEITHGFDDTGRQFDSNGDLKDWWEPSTKERFIEKSKCIIYQYGNYTEPSAKMNALIDLILTICTFYNLCCLLSNNIYKYGCDIAYYFSTTGVSTSASLCISLILTLLIFSALQLYKNVLGESRLMTLVAGYISSWLFLLFLTAINNLETLVFGKGFQARFLPEVALSLFISCFAAGLVHRVSITVCFVCSLLGLYYLNKMNQSTYASSVPLSKKKK